MTKFDISYKYRDNFHAAIVEAESAVDAKTYFEAHKPGAEILGDVTEHDETTAKLEALKAYLIKEKNFTEEEANEAFYDERFDSFQCGSWEYTVFTEEEAEKAAAETIQDDLWAFNPEFILHHTEFYKNSNGREDEQFLIALRDMQGRLCESANAIVKALILDLDEFVEDAINEDGRGHFLSSYDGYEIELGEFYAYRVN